VSDISVDISINNWIASLNMLFCWCPVAFLWRKWCC